MWYWAILEAGAAIISFPHGTDKMAQDLSYLHRKMVQKYIHSVINFMKWKSNYDILLNKFVFIFMIISQKNHSIGFISTNSKKSIESNSTVSNTSLLSGTMKVKTEAL